MPMTIGSNDRLRLLEQIILDLSPVAVCVSGGIDSSFLLWVCSRIVPKDKLVALTFNSATTPAREMDQAKNMIELCGVRHMVYPGPEMNNPEFLHNDLLRCYYCKRERFNFLLNKTEIGTNHRILDGSVIDDLQDYRPGGKALAEAGITSPMVDARISKKDIRILARENNLDLAGYINESCLATRIKTGQPISAAVLTNIAEVEDAMHRLGFSLVRARWNCGEIRLEVDPQELPRAFKLRGQVSESLRRCGVETVSVDIRGYKPEGGGALE